jgi:polyisoprenoid-binding protein YceI
MPIIPIHTPRRLHRPFAMLLIAVTFFTAAVATADATRAGRLALDPHHTVVAFHLGGTLHDVYGTFALESGTLSVDPDAETASGTIVVSAASGESGNTSRDERMANAVLESARFPEIRFRAERVEGRPEPDGTFHATLYGVLTLHGDEHDVAVIVDGRLAGDVVAAHGRFTVPYVAWGISDPSILLLSVAKTVDIDVTTEGRVVWNDAAHTTGDQ